MKILLHICCASCAVYPVKLLQKEKHGFAGFWFNPNIHPYQEYELRLGSLKLLENRLNMDVIYTEKYDPAEYFKMFKTPYLTENPPNPSLQKGGEGGFNRCKSCYKLRLEKTAEAAKRHNFDAFSTTLLISPYQNFKQIADIGRELSEKYNVFFYLKDFRQYFREAMTYSREAGLYRQKYCGCIYSREERQKTQKLKFKNQSLEERIN